MTTVRLDHAAIEALRFQVPEELLAAGERVAERAAALAPHKTGASAASITAQVVGGDEVHVSWGREKFWMLFFELGTSKMSARPFLRPALDAEV